MSGLSLGLGLGLAGRGGVAYEAEATALFARMSVQPSTARKAAYNRFIAAGKHDGWWPKADAIWLMAAHDAQAGRLNLVSATYNLALVGAPTFTVDRGYAGDASAAYLSTGLNLASGGLKAKRDDHTILSWANSDTAVSVADIGGSDISVNGRDSGNALATRSAGTTPDTSAGLVTTLGLTGLSRAAGASYTQYRNGRAFAVKTATSAAFASQVLFIGGRNNGSGALTAGTTRQQSFAFVGGALSAAEHLALFEALYSLMEAVGNVPALRSAFATAALRQDFSVVPNGDVPAAAQTGQMIGQYEPNTSINAVVGGFYRLANVAASGSDAAYIEAAPGAPVQFIGADIAFDDAAGTRTANNGVAAIAIWGDGGVVANGLGRRAKLHATISATALTVQYRSTLNGSLVTVFSRALASPLAKDLTAYRAGFAFAAGVCWILGPDGVIEAVSSAGFSDTPSDKLYACWEPYVLNADLDTQSVFRAVYATG